MLCTKIIFTNEFASSAHSLSDFMHKAGIHHGLKDNADSAELETDADDEGLYEVCCEISRLILNSAVKPAVMSFLHKYYGCFNSDESRIILCNVMRRDFLGNSPVEFMSI